MRKIALPLMAVLLLLSCQNDSTLALENEKLDQHTIKMVDGVVVSKLALESVVSTIFKYPNLHSNGGNNENSGRNECPKISPDPTMPIAMFPINYNINFGGNGCSPTNGSDLSGHVELNLDGVLCEGVGTVACITFKNNFEINGIDVDGKMSLTYLGMDSNGNLCFDSSIEGLNIDNSEMVIKSSKGGKITMIDVLENNNPLDDNSFIDDIHCQSYSSLKMCIEGTDYDVATNDEIKTVAICACPISGGLIGTDGLGNPLSIDFGPNLACTGDVILNGNETVLPACD